jgi:hypothetical protein
MKYGDWTGGFTRLVRQLPLLAWSIQAARRESANWSESLPVPAARVMAKR